MSGEAQVDVLGNLGADPELKFTPQGEAIAEFSIANTPRRKNEQGDWVDGDTTWYRVTAWRRDAEAVAENLAKGDRVRVQGRLSVRPYTSKGGEERVSLDVTANMDGVTKFLKAKPRGKSEGDPWSGS